MSSKILILLNPAADKGRSKERMDQVALGLKERKVPFEVVLGTQAEHAQAIRQGVEEGVTSFAAAGGDGTLRDVLEELMKFDPETRAKLRLGAIGVGSSNDFLKPPDPDRWIGKAQVALDPKTAHAREVYRVETEAGEQHYLMNASIGLIAKGTQAFNHPPLWLRGLRKVLGHARAVTVHTLVSVLTDRGVRAKISTPDRQEEGLFWGVTLLNCPHIAPGVIYQTPRTDRDGLFDVLALTKTDPQTLGEISESLAQEVPRDEPPVAYFQASEVSLEFPEATLVEFDGEVVESRWAKFTILPEAITILGRGV